MKKKSTSEIMGGIQAAKSEREYQAEDDLRTLQRAIEVKNDPARYKRAREMARKKLAELAAISVADNE